MHPHLSWVTMWSVVGGTVRGRGEGGKTEGEIQQQMQWQLVVVTCTLDLWRKVATTKEYTKNSFIIVTFLTYMYKCVTLLRISNMTWRLNRQYWKWAHLKCEYISESAHLLEPIFAPSWPSDLTKGGSIVVVCLRLWVEARSFQRIRQNASRWLPRRVYFSVWVEFEL